jgi:hypothetical protein
MKRLLLCGAVALLLAGCGHAATAKDPFVGTWRLNSGERVRYVISKHDGVYTVAERWPGRTTWVTIFARSGDHLIGMTNIRSRATGKLVGIEHFEFSVGQVPERLLFHFDATNQKLSSDDTMSRTSDSAAIPTPGT